MLENLKPFSNRHSISRVEQTLPNMALLSSLIINPEIEKHSILNKKEIFNEYITNDQITDLKDTYFYMHKGFYDNVSSVKDYIYNQLFLSTDRSLKISENVLSQSFSVIDELYPSIIENLYLDNISTTSYGTVVFDWEKGEANVFSLEIGASNIGYFIEINGVDTKQVDSEGLESHKYELINDLNIFLGV